MFDIVARNELGTFHFFELTGIGSRFAEEPVLLVVGVLVEDAHPVIRIPAEMEILVGINLRARLFGLLERGIELHSTRLRAAAMSIS